MLTPDTESALAALVAAADAPFAIEGQGTKRAMLRPVQAAATISTRNLTGITLHRPTELIISARAGTPVAEVEAMLATKGQMLIAEPPSYAGIFGAGNATIGGAVAAGISGPRRITGGAMRDHVMGVRFVNGAGEVMHSGGRVLKNVTGLDLCKLLTGSHGTLGIITEVTLKVLPRPEATATLAVNAADFATGQRVLSAGLGAPYGVSGAAIVGHRALLRIEDFAESVAYRIAKLRQDLAEHGASEIIEGEASRALWRDVAEATPLDLAPDDAVWRVSVKPSEGPRLAAALRTAFDAKLMLDWGGGLVWVAGPATEAAHRAVMAAAEDGAFLLFRAPDALRAAVPVIKPDAPALATIARRVKAALDPRGLFNPGRMQAGF
ncbi:glycolate oxidase subunit GlcE [Plastoroseomonas arctica]|uniref:glycolate oxidase subunit GlcE n=1 Tax=Plastoroseomonas arctica TaxID=1509237 RepID=UPI001BACE425|nr:glycolate oxidase subunit GlcE [Plastoroseomonas arctica]